MDTELRDALIAYTDSHTAVDGIYRTDVPGLALLRSNHPTPLEHKLYYERAFIVVVQGAKDLLVGTQRLRYGAGTYLVMSVAMPVRASITEATKARPYLSLAIDMERQTMAELLESIAVPGDATPESGRGFFVGTPDARQISAVRRIAPLLADPDALRMLYPGIVREVLYWSLTGQDGAEIRRLAAPEGHVQRIADAIAAMRSAFPHTLPIDRLASIANMSPSSFHQHFKAITALSPLQFQKRVRLLEARRLMLTGGTDATRAAYHVGYESLSQFTREYARMFGAPPRRDVSAVLAAAS